ncbi:MULTISPECIES: hypothetical protein [unclassified Bradyrhizobium]|uniref:hypothetical protein n=1 Tax=unclassified Bradyrhizobium TaxID=2631580 RepID=UPI002FF3CE4A
MSNELERRPDGVLGAATTTIHRRAMRRPPTAWWRSIGSKGFHKMALWEMRRSIEKVELLGEPRWRDAVAGDAAAAIGIVLSMRPEDSSRQKFDLAMTALVVCACGGSAAACIVLANVIRRLPSAGNAEARIATSWRVRAFRSLVDCSRLERPR